MLRITPIPLIAYPALSLLAYLMYAHDKLSAIRGTWRVSESSLHLVEAAGGWPGAYVAQQTMRHKTVKASYQVVFWLIVSVHVVFWALWAFFPACVLGLLVAIQDRVESLTVAAAFGRPIGARRESPRCPSPTRRPSGPRHARPRP